MGVIMLDEYARPKEQRATFPDIASRELSIVKKKSGWWRLFDTLRFMHHVYEVLKKYRENIEV